MTVMVQARTSCVYTIGHCNNARFLTADYNLLLNCTVSILALLSERHSAVTICQTNQRSLQLIYKHLYGGNVKLADDHLGHSFV